MKTFNHKKSDKTSFGKRINKDRSERPFRKSGKPSFEKRRDEGGSERPFRKSGKPSFEKRRDEGGSERPFRKSGKPTFEKRREESGSERPFRKSGKPSFERRREESGSERPFRKSGKPTFEKRREESGSERPFRKSGKPLFEKRRDEGGSERPFRKSGVPSFERRREESRSERPFRKSGKPSFEKRRDEGGSERPFRKSVKTSYEKRSASVEKSRPVKKSFSSSPNQSEATGLIRLNKYISNSGICSRREADELIKAGLITVNGNIVSELGTKINAGDEVKYNGERMRNERKRYVLLNKPKDYITTTDDPEKRNTVMELIKDACRERVYPVGRLDRNTTGLLLFTNDGELAKRLMHPSSNISKLYHVETDKPVRNEDLKKIAEGVELEDGIAKADAVEYDHPVLKTHIGLQIHEGRNRIVRRIFETLGYEIHKLDRTVFAGLTKKDLPRGRWRHLSEMEVNMLKMLTGKKAKQA